MRDVKLNSLPFSLPLTVTEVIGLKDNVMAGQLDGEEWDRGLRNCRIT